MWDPCRNEDSSTGTCVTSYERSFNKCNLTDIWFRKVQFRLGFRSETSHWKTTILILVMRQKQGRRQQCGGEKDEERRLNGYQSQRHVRFGDFRVMTAHVLAETRLCFLSTAL
jgi:hypothetical protein